MVTRLPDSGLAPTPVDSTKSPHTPGSSPAQVGESTSLPLTAARQLDILQLQDRQAVLARVAQLLTSGNGLPEQAILDIKGRSLTVMTMMGETSLEAGDWVKLMRAGNELQLLGKLAPAPEARIAQALAQRLPWQQRLDVGLSELNAVLTNFAKATVAGPAGREPLPMAVREAILQLVNQLPSSESLGNAVPGKVEATAARIKSWIVESGVFAEARIVRTPEAPLADLKLALGRIVSSLLAQQGADTAAFNRYTPLVSQELVQAPLQFPNAFVPPAATSSREPMDAGQMLRLLAGMLNRITVNQLHSQVLTNRTAAEAPVPATLLLELPWLNPQGEPRVAQLRIDHDRQGPEQKDSARKPKVAEWRFSLSLDLDDAGPVFFEVALREAQISARVWAEQQATLRQVQSQMGTLRTRLSELGLDVVDLECRRGSPQAATTRLEQRLVDTRA
ncbi:flagellar hook-length control protein FliK [Marinobacter salicampi]|uniref:flagellar hook-length control protein FliK n=1 Tax=Marinobacter salicampi TaxID=435907 RepID=UPI001408EBB0|nr:flagellar hook-length control protein FliK [Marinobacter salicampi]